MADTTQKKAAAKTTHYLVFVAAEVGKFDLVGEFVANGPEQAARLAGEAFGTLEADLFAVPSRNWTYVPRRVEQREPVVTYRSKEWDPNETVHEAAIAALGDGIPSDPEYSAAGGSLRVPNTDVHPADTIEED